MSDTFWIGKDAERLKSTLGELAKQGYVVVSNALDGNMYAGTNKRGLRVSVGFATDVLKNPDSIPMKARFFGILVLDESEVSDKFIKAKPPEQKSLEETHQ